MAKVSFILTLFLISFSYSTISLAIPDDDVIDPNLPTTPSLALPSEKQELDETTTVGLSEILPEKTELKPTGTIETLDRPNKIFRFHPINHRFPKRPCRHGRGMGDKPMMRPRQLSFGDDMIVAMRGDRKFDPMVQDDVRQVGERWIRIHRRPHHHHHHHEDEMPRFPMGKHHEFVANQRDEEREERGDGGFMWSVRKFLNGQF